MAEVGITAVDVKNNPAPFVDEIELEVRRERGAGPAATQSPLHQPHPPLAASRPRRGAPPPPTRRAAAPRRRGRRCNMNASRP
jgi:hypothetical protein